VPKARETEAKIDTWDSFKPQGFYTARGTVSEKEVAAERKK
jgi:hypothetical protein